MKGLEDGLVLPPGGDGVATRQGVDVAKQELHGAVPRNHLIEDVPGAQENHPEPHGKGDWRTKVAHPARVLTKRYHGHGRASKGADQA